MTVLRVYLMLGALAALALGGWKLHHDGYNAGRASAELTNARAIADANAAAVQNWRDAAAEQAKEDAARRARDLAGDAATAADLSRIAARFEALAKQPRPSGRCEFSADWISRYNEAK